ncbi:peroxidase family protein [Cellulomonas sp. ATA003]|uniref:peroxidase family protein n=1 Tax=Cellulomonas sp. ATA003 TaxID=3073064 RepID=UPI002873CE9A|nr:peroxidase family protein [Cellulomonas sp. ATA003]WNB85388.1 peroxidase family protein [Cellulomonas sp. ATA003]
MSTPSVPRRDGGGSGRPRTGRRSGTRLRAAVGAGLSACVAFAGIITGPTAMAATDTDPDFRLTKADLEFILKQINIGEAHAEAITTGDTEYSLLCDDPNDRSWTCVPSPMLPYGLRTVDGSFNNLEEDDTKDYGAAGRTFPRIAPANFRDAGRLFFDPDGPNGPAQAGGMTSYDQVGENNVVVDEEPRIISNLVVDQTVMNPAAVAMMGVVEGSYAFDHDGDGFNWEVHRTSPEYDPADPLPINPVTNRPFTPDRVFIPNVSPDVGLSAPFTGWFTLFGQFFDHGLDLVSKGGNGTVFVPVLPGDELYNPASPRTNFIPLTRATVTMAPGPDGQLGTSDDTREHTNRTTPFIDQNQTYTSHPSHQVFLREYELVHGRPVPTGHLLDGAKGGPPTWAEVKYQAKTILGIQLDDMDALTVPLLVTDPYGRFVAGPTGFPQIVVSETDVREGSIDTPVDATQAMDAGVSFLDDIANGAEPKLDTLGEPALDLYDSAKLDAHYITGDGRGNENIGLTAVHHIFHAEHNRVADQVMDVLEAPGNEALLRAYQSQDGIWDLGERVFQAGRFVTEMEYQHLVFEEFVRSIQPAIDAGPLNETRYDSNIDPSVTAEFAHAVYRFGHSMLTSDVDRAGFGTESLSLFDAFLNPSEFTDNGRLTPDQGAASLLMGMSKQTGNGIDEFVDSTLRNQLLGVALDLSAINIARARDTGMPTLNELRTVFYEETADSALKPYENWTEFELTLKNRASIVNFIAAYAPSIKAAGGSVDARRTAAQALMADPAFMSSNAGLNDIDLWVGGLAERNMDFGGMLGSTFNKVFEEHMEDLQNGDRFYYLFRTAGMDLINKLEANSFSELAMRTTDATGLHHNIFANPTRTFEVADQATWSDGDATTPDLAVINGWHRFDGEEHVVIHGTDAVDSLHGGIGDDSIWGHSGNDRLEGWQGNDILVGHGGNDVLTDSFGDDVIHGGDGDDAINAGSGLDLLFGGFGKDFILHGQDPTESFAGDDDDFIRGGNGLDVVTGNSGDDWLEGGGAFDLLQGDNALTFQNDPKGGADVLMGQGGLDDHDAEGGDDIMDNDGIDRHHGMLGFDWVTHKHDPRAANADLGLTIFQAPDVTLSRSRFAQVEGVSGWSRNDILRGGRAPGDPAFADDGGHELTQAGIDRISGLRELLGGGDVPKYGAQFMTKNAEKPHNIMLGGGGSDILESGAGDDYIDGDAALDFYLEWTNPANGAVERQETMQPFQTRVFNGTISPADIHIVRAIIPHQGEAAPDTAAFEDLREMYSITKLEDGLYRVAHIEEDAGGLASGVDILRNIELVQFADVTQDLLTGAVDPSSPSGTIEFSTMAPVEHEPLTATSALVDGVSGEPVPADDIEWVWQWADDEGEFTPSESEGALTSTFTPGDAEAGYALRVVATFTDAGGTLRTVASGLTSPVQNINDAPVYPQLVPQSPVIGEPVTFDQSQLNDADTLYNDDGDLIVTLNYQWQESNGTSWRNIANAKSSTFTPTEAQKDRRLRMILRFNDFLGTPEVVDLTTGPVSSVATVPTAPALGTVTVGHESATVTWTAVTGEQTGGVDLLGYAVQVLAEDGTTPVGPLRNVGADTTSLKVRGLTNGTTYRFRVQAANLVGGGAFSASSAAVTPVSLTPGAATISSAVAGDASATVTWAAPAETGGSAVTGYEIQVINAGGILTIREIPATATSHVITGLSNGVPHTFTVRALNDDGPGPWSAVSAEVLPSEDAEEPAEPGLSGTVTAGGVALGGASVNVYTADTRTWLKSVLTGADGSYSLTGLPAGSYRLYVQPNEPGYANQWHAGTSFESAATITVSGATTADIALVGTHTLSGVVRTGTGVLAGATVQVYTASTRTWLRSATSAADGAYSVAGLPVGSYRLYVQPNEPGLPNRWFGGASFETATVVTVDGATAMDVVLSGAGSLSGSVMAGGQPLSGAAVQVYTADTRTWVRSGTSGADGSYSVPGLTAGSYRLYVQPNEPGYPNRWFGGVSFETATEVAVDGATPMDVVLSTAGSLSGAVTAGGQALSGAAVQVYTADTRTWVRSGTSGADGAYSVAGLPAGSYRLYVQPNEPGYPNRWLGGASFETATVVTVDGATPMDVVLSGTHTLSGTVTAGGSPLEGASVSVYTADTRTWLKSVVSGANGSYSLTGLPAGSYRLYVQPNEPGHANRWFGGSGFDTATVIAVDGATQTDIGLG